MAMDYDFLKALNEHKTHTVYARVILLNFQENPIDTLEGKITSGSINIDGTSAVRRTCQFSMITSILDSPSYNWGIQSKFRFEVGLENPFYQVVGSEYKDYPEIIWFNEGMYVCTSYNSSVSTNNYTVNISGKDKMCLLNGEVGGTITGALSNDLTSIDEITYTYTEDDTVTIENWRPGKWYTRSYVGVYTLDTSDSFNPDAVYFKATAETVKTDLWLGDIITGLVHVYGGEPYQNIIIQDIPENLISLLTYYGDKSLYMLKRRQSGGEIDQLILDDTTQVDYWDGTKYVGPCAIGDLEEKGFQFASGDTLLTSSENNAQYGIVKNPLDPTTSMDDGFNVLKYDYGELVGFHQTPFTYGDQLVAQLGQTISSVLDTIVKRFTNYEYFYDLDGHFVFQKKKSQVNVADIGLRFLRQGVQFGVENEDKVTYDWDDINGLTEYDFSDGTLFTQISRTPQIGNIKNDYSIWGARSSGEGGSAPIHYRYVISERPEKYTSIRDGKTYRSTEVNWRELIYQMAIDYYQENQTEDFLMRVARANPQYPTGYTGYEMLYSDMQGFWRQLYKTPPEWVMQRIEVTKDNFEKLKNKLYITYGQDYQKVDDNTAFDEKYTYYQPIQKEVCNSLGWNMNVINNPTTINFWLDFCSDGALMKFSTQNIGDRAKTVNDTTIKSIYYEEAPNVIFQFSDEEINREDAVGYTIFKVDKGLRGTRIYTGGKANMEGGLVESSQGKSAKEELTSLLNNNALLLESISLTSIPIYYLDVNTRISVVDQTRGVSGNYLISKITMPLAYNGTMSITASNILDTIL